MSVTFFLPCRCNTLEGSTGICLETESCHSESVGLADVTSGDLEGSCVGRCCRGGHALCRVVGDTTIQSYWAEGFSPLPPCPCPHPRASSPNTYSCFGPISEILFPFWTCPLAFIQWRAMWRHLTCAWQSEEIKISNRKVKQLICIRCYECLIPNLLFLSLTLLTLAACTVSVKYRSETFWACGSR